MSTTTSTLNLVKPASSDYVDLSVINDNYDKIDQFADGVVNGNYVEDASYVHTDNNFTSALKNKLDAIESNANNYSLPTASTGTLGGVKVDGSTVVIDSNGVISSVSSGGTTVVANPSGTATTALNSLQVGSSIYSVSGGTTVIGNPSGTATTELDTIQIGNTVFNIPDPNPYVPTGVTYTISIPSYATFQYFDCIITQYTNGTQTAQDNLSYAKTLGGTTSVTVGDVKVDFVSPYTLKFTSLTDYLSYNGSAYETDDEMFSKVLEQSGGGAFSAEVTEVEMPGGDTVSWSQSQLTGTKIAEITINGSTTNVYAPTSGGATALSGLSDVDLTSPANGQILGYNSSTSKWENTIMYTDVIGTLTAGSTSITLSDASITSSSTIDVYTDLDVPYNSKSLSTGSITLTFDEQASNMSVKVRVS